MMGSNPEFNQSRANYLFDREHGPTSYEIGDIISSGGMADVYEGTMWADDEEKEVAIKFHKLGRYREINRAAILSEIDILKHTSKANPYLVSIEGVYVDKIRGVGIVMEKLTGIPGNEFFESHSEELIGNHKNVCSITTEMCIALQELHRAGIVHADIKPQNFYFEKVNETDEETEYIVKLLDFGLSAQVKVEEDNKSDTVRGTPAYMAPELLEGNNNVRSSDLYNIGLVMFEALVGVRFSHLKALVTSDIDIFKKLQNTDTTAFGKEINTIIEHLLGNKDPKERRTITFSSPSLLQGEYPLNSAADLAELLKEIVHLYDIDDMNSPPYSYIITEAEQELDQYV